MPKRERERLAALADKRGFFIIEDEAYAFLAEPAPKPIQVLAPERTVYVTSLSKSFASGLRVGFVVTPPALEEQKRADARKRQALMRKILRHGAIVAHPASYFLWLQLPEGLRADEVAAQLSKEGVLVTTAEPYSTLAHAPQALRLALGSVALREALGKVDGVLGY